MIDLYKQRIPSSIPSAHLSIVFDHLCWYIKKCLFMEWNRKLKTNKFKKHHDNA